MKLKLAIALGLTAAAALACYLITRRWPRSFDAAFAAGVITGFLGAVSCFVCLPLRAVFSQPEGGE